MHIEVDKVYINSFATFNTLMLKKVHFLLDQVELFATNVVRIKRGLIEMIGV